MKRFPPPYRTVAHRSVALVLSFVALSLTGASHRTPNFIITAPTQSLAKLIGMNAEAQRRELAISWLGEELPAWPQPCVISVRVAPGLRPSGETSYVFERGVPRDCFMRIQGSYDLVLDSVLPHEMLHVVFATYFGRPLPRGLEEGACVYVEHQSSKQQLGSTLARTLETRSSLHMDRFFVVDDDYPHNVLRFYSEAYSLVEFLIERGGQRQFVQFLQDGLDRNQWPQAAQKHYGYGQFSEMQTAWLEWAAAREHALRFGSPGQVTISVTVAEPRAEAESAAR